MMVNDPQKHHKNIGPCGLTKNLIFDDGKLKKMKYDENMLKKNMNIHWKTMKIPLKHETNHKTLKMKNALENHENLTKTRGKP